MGKSAEAFGLDIRWAEQKRDALLKGFYKCKAFEGRYVFADKGRLAKFLQEQVVDTLVQGKDGQVIAIEEKMVRWPGRHYTAFTLETWSCTIPGRERKGWMHTAQCDILLYCFEQEDRTLKAYSIPFRALQAWFLPIEDRFPRTRTTQINQTECRVVPIDEVIKGVAGCKLYYIGGEQ